MQYVVYISLIFLSFSFSVQSTEEIQQRMSRGDSLTSLLDTVRAYDRRIHLLEELSDYYSYIDGAKAMYYAAKIKDLATQEGDNRGIGIAHYRIGGVYFERNEVDSAIFEYERAEQFLQHDTSYLAQHTLARVWHNQGAMYQRKGDYDTYLDMLLNHAIPIQESIGDMVGLGKNYHAIGLVFQATNEFERAIHYQRKAIATLNDKPHVPELTDAYTMAVESYFLANDFMGESLKTIKKFLHKADSLLQRYPDTYSHVLYLQALGLYEETVEKDLKKALTTYLKGNQLAKDNGMSHVGVKVLLRAYYVYDKLGDHETA